MATVLVNWSQSRSHGSISKIAARTRSFLQPLSMESIAAYLYYTSRWIRVVS